MRYLIFSLIFLLCSCASTVTNIHDDTHTLSPGTGFVLLPVYRNTSIYQIRFSGPKNFQFSSEDLYYKNKKTYMLVELPVGEYSFSEIRLNKYTKISDFESKIWSFTLKPDVINYVGHFVILNHSKVWGSYQLSYEIHNNSSVALEYLEKEYPQLIQSYSINYAGPGTDTFFSFIDNISSGEK